MSTNNTGFIKKRKKILKYLSAAVAFSVTYSLILPAITIDEETAGEEPGIVLNENSEEITDLSGASGSEETAAEEQQEEPVQEEETVQEETVTEEAPEEQNIETPSETAEEETEIKLITKEDDNIRYLEMLKKQMEDTEFISTAFYEVKNAEEWITAEPEKIIRTEEDQECRVLYLDEDEFVEIKNPEQGEENIRFEKNEEGIKEITFRGEKEFDIFTLTVTEEKEAERETTETAAEQNTEETEEVSTVSYPAAELEGRSNGVTVKVSAPEGAFPEGTKMTVKTVSEAEVLDTVTDTVNKEIKAVQAVDIIFKDKDGNEIEPLVPIQVSMVSDEIGKAESSEVVHIDEEGKGEIVEQNSGSKDNEVVFESDSFSVYVIVYTVDFHYEVDGKTYDYSIEGGSCISLSELVKVLKVIEDDPATEMDEVWAFVKEVKEIKFSTPELVYVSKAAEDTTAGKIKADNNLECEYSAELTKEQIADINNRHVEAGDWALVCIQPFTSEEVLTVIMKNGESFTVSLTTATLASNCLTEEGENYRIKVTFDKNDEIPEGTRLKVSEIDSESDVFLQHLGKILHEINREYFEVEEMRSHYNEGMGLLPVLYPVNVDKIRFFDISLSCNGVIFEPKAPVQVEISYDRGLIAPEAEKTVAGIANVVNDTVELIENPVIVQEKDGRVTGFSCQLTKLSEIGTFVGQETKDTVIEPARMRASLSEGKKLKGTVTEKKAVRFGLLKGGNDNEEEDDEEEGEELQLPDHPQASKTLSYNGDGTYTLALNVTGAAEAQTQTEVTKSNVLIVMDRSSSMVNNNASVTYHEYSGPYQYGVTYYGYYNGEYVQLYYYNGNYYRTNYYGYYYDRYTGTRYTRETQTRLAAEQEALNSLIGQLVGKNSNDTVTGENGETISLADVIEVKVISFASYRTDSGKNSSSSITHDGDFSKTESSWSTNAETLSEAVNDNSVAKGTNWEEAMQYAKEVADAKKKEQPDEKVYVVFLTDGEPTDIAGGNGNAQYYQDNERCLKAAWDDAQKIVTPHTVSTADGDVTTDHELYGIFTYGDTDAQKKYLRRLVNYAYGKGDDAGENVTGGTADYYYDADSTSALLNAFQNILSSITNALEFGRISIIDGITTDAATTAVINGSARGFRYIVKGPVGELYSVRTSGDSNNPSVEFTIGTTTYSGDQVELKTGADDKKYYSVTVGDTEYKMALADIDSNKKVTWDLSAIGTLMDGYTYTLECAIWPDQDAYDYVAGLNNGLPGFTWDSNAATQVKDEDNNVLYEVGGVSTYPSIVKYPNGTFSVVTNTEQTLTYSIVSTEKDEITGEETVNYDGPHDWPLTPPNPMPLIKTKMAVEKVWETGLDPDEFSHLLYENDIDPKKYTVDLRIWRADTIEELQSLVNANGNNSYLDVTVGWDEQKHEYVWSKDFTVAPGHIVTLENAEFMGVDTSDSSRKVKYNGTDYYIIEKGHYYTISEPDIDRHYELNCEIYHPMIIDGVLSQVTIKNGVVTEAVALSKLEADNTLKGGINVQKKVFDDKNHEVTTTEDTFTVTLELKYKDGTPYIDFDYRIFYGENNPKYYDTEHYPYHRTGHIFGTAAPEDSVAEDTDSPQPYENQRHILNNTDGKITVELYVGDSLRLINAPAGIRYSVTEDTSKLEECYTYDSITYEISENDSNNYKPAKPNSDGTYTVKGNSAGLATVKNKVPGADVNLVKISTGDKNKPMSGVKFKLYYDENCQRQVLKDSIGHPVGIAIYEEPTGGDGETPEEPVLVDKGVLITDEDGKLELGTFISGYYYLKEISTWEGFAPVSKPVPIKIDEDGKVSYRQEDYIASYSSPLEVNEDGSFTITINNNPAATLPSTGGSGTDLIYLIGIIITVLAGASLMKRLRRRAA